MANSGQARDESARFYEDKANPWRIEMVPREIGPREAHPAWRCAVFVVHGIGTQTSAEIAAVLRSGFDDAWAAITNDPSTPKPLRLPPPFVRDAWWANYEDVENTFPEDWRLLEEEQKKFFRELWKQRTRNALGTVSWFIKQQVGLLRPRILREMGFVAYLLYVFLQIVSPGILLALLFWRRELVNGFLTDVRMYAEPRGVTERAIVQRIDARVAETFLQLIGLDCEFRTLPAERLLKASGKPLFFERVVWVAHSLGTVISYNVLSDLFHRAAEIEQVGDKKQREGVRLFRQRLRRFVTLGSPLDKFAYLFPTAVRPWPRVAREQLLEGGDAIDGTGKREWWINYYHVLDPVSGALGYPDIKGGIDQPNPSNIHLRGAFKIPGAAHVAFGATQTCCVSFSHELTGRLTLPIANSRPRVR